MLSNLISQNKEALGISQYSKEKYILNTDYSLSSLIAIFDSFKPDIIFDFKIYKVSSSVNSYEPNFNMYSRYSKNITEALSAYSLANKVKVNLISTSHLDMSKNTSHPYLVLKKSQEEFYKNISNDNCSIVIHRIPNIFGENDLNFTRILPFFFGNYLTKKTEIVFNSDGHFLRNYLYLENLIEFLISDKTIQESISTLSNVSLLTLVRNFFKENDLIFPEIYWKGNKTELDSSIHKNYTLSQNNLELFERVFRWYIKNKIKVVKHFEFYENSL